MSQTYDYILEHGTLVNHDGEGRRDIGVRNGTIEAIGDLSQASAGQVVDCTGMVIIPGLVNTHHHMCVVRFVNKFCAVPTTSTTHHSPSPLPSLACHAGTRP